MQKQKIDELEREIIWCRNEIETRQAMLKHQDDEILKLRQKILELEDDKKALRNIVKSEIKPITRSQSNRKESK